MDDPLKISILPLPARSKPTASSFDTRATSVKRWVESLPLASLKQSARQIYETLKEVNCLDIPPKRRLGFLEQLHGTVGFISGELEKRYILAAFPLPPLQYRVALLNQKFQQAMATGYMLVLQDLLVPRRSLLRRLTEKPLVCIAVHRTLRYMGKVLLRCYQVYAPYPENTWREIHHLFEMASALNCVHRKVQDPQYATIQRANAKEAYKQILLFSLASPYRLRPGESASVYQALESWASYCRLSRISEADREVQGLFGVQPDTDQQPTYLELKAHHAGQTSWVLDTAELGTVLLQHAACLQEGPDAVKGLPAGLTADLLDRLMKSWGIMTLRREERILQDGHIEVVLGFTAAHRALSAPAEQADPEEPQPDGFELTLAENSSAQWAIRDPANDPAQGFVCVVRDETPAGLRLQWQGDSRLKVTVGSPIALRRPSPAEGNPEWMLGIVRWLRAKHTDVIQFGVQLLPGQPQAVEIQPLVAGQASGRPVEGFRLLEREKSAAPPSLLVPGFLEHFDRPEVLVQHQGLEQTLKLTRLVESTGVLAHFECEPTTEPAPRSSPASVDQETSFDNFSELL